MPSIRCRRTRPAFASCGRASASSRCWWAWRCWSVRCPAAAIFSSRFPGCAARAPAASEWRQRPSGLPNGALGGGTGAEVAQAGGKPVMLDFYADWCVSCKEMERFTFTDPAVRSRMDRMLLLKADVTANTADDAALLKRFDLFGPPGTIFFDRAGQELPKRVIGFQPAEQFSATLDAALRAGREQVWADRPVRRGGRGCADGRPIPPSLDKTGCRTASRRCCRPLIGCAARPGRPSRSGSTSGAARCWWSTSGRPGARLAARRSRRSSGCRTSSVPRDCKSSASPSISRQGRPYAAEMRINYPVLVGDLEAIDLARQAGNRLGGLPYHGHPGSQRERRQNRARRRQSGKAGANRPATALAAFLRSSRAFAVNLQQFVQVGSRASGNLPISPRHASWRHAAMMPASISSNSLKIWTTCR